MKQLFRFVLIALTMTAVLVSCDKKEEENVTLVPSKTTVTADGADKVTFTVKYGTQDVTSSAEINVDGTKLSAAEFTTTAAGEYKFKATYNGKTSPEVTVTATAAPVAALVLSADKTSFVADNTDKVVFTVMQDGVDVTANSNVCMTGDLGVCLVSPEFFTDEAGEYEFYATLKDGDESNKSNIVKVTATAPPVPGTLTLTVDKTSIPANGEDVVIFTVKLDGADVTADSQICITGMSCLTTNEFSSEEPGEYEFYATYDELESNTLTVTVTGFFPNIAMLRFTNNGCGPCTNYMNNFFTPRILPIIDGHYVEMVVHAAYPNPNDPNLYSDFYELGRAWGLPWEGGRYGVPNGNFDMKWVNYGLYADAVSGSSVDITEMKNRIQDLVDNKVSDVGFQVVSSITDGKVTVDVTVKSTKTDTYTLFVALLEDGVAGTQSGVSGTYYHDNTLRALVTSGNSGENLGEIAAGQTITKKYNVDVKSGWNADNCKLFICVTNVVNGKKLINNACHADIDGTTPYRYK